MNITKIGLRILMAIMILAGSGLTGTARPEAGTTERVSVASDGTEGNEYSFNPSISADGRYVAFESYASTLVAGDTNNFCDNDGDFVYDENCADIFVHDRLNGETTRVSVASDGTQGDDYSIDPSISADGRYVAFYSMATNLVSGDTNGYYDIFVHDRDNSETTRVSVASNGDEGNAYSLMPSISGDGRFVAFESGSNNLVYGDNNGIGDIFVHDRDTGETTRVSVSSDGTEADSYCQESSISTDGRFIAFLSAANTLVAGDTNGHEDIFVHDRSTGETTRVSVASDGTQGNDNSMYPSISSDGSYVAFQSFASNLVDGDTNIKYDIFVHDRASGATTRVSVKSDGSPSNGHSHYPHISSDGKYITFESLASNLVDSDTNAWGDIFVHDQLTGATTRVSVSADGSEGNDPSYGADISASGRYVAFSSDASNLVNGDTNGYADIFWHDRGITSSYSTWLPLAVK